MLQFLRRPVELHGLSHYILTRGLWVAGTLLLSALVFLRGPGNPWLAGWYARYLQDSALVLTGVALIGGLLVEDVLRRR